MGRGNPLGVLLLVAGLLLCDAFVAWLPVCSLFVPGWAHAVYNPLECYNFFTGSILCWICLFWVIVHWSSWSHGYIELNADQRSGGSNADSFTPNAEGSLFESICRDGKLSQFRLIDNTLLLSCRLFTYILVGSTISRTCTLDLRVDIVCW